MAEADGVVESRFCVGADILARDTAVRAPDRSNQRIAGRQRYRARDERQAGRELDIDLDTFESPRV